MRMLTCTAAALLAAATAICGQTAAPDTAWRHQLVGGLNLTQVQLKDWSGGGQDALAYKLTLNGKSVYKRERVDWTHTYKLAFGQTKLGSQDIRKTDDRIDLESAMVYRVGLYVNPYLATTLKTQFARGYAYTADTETPVSHFFDPAYLTQTAGVGYQARPELKTRLGLGVREILTRDYPAYADDAKTAKVEKTSVQAILESVTHAEWQLAQNILATSKLELVAPLTDLTGGSIRSDSNLAVKVTQYVTVGLDLQLVDDNRSDVNDALQVKEALSLGLSYTFM